jgi:multiple antibiotic resistance protein
MTHIEFVLLAFTSLLTMMNPISVIPIYSSFTKELDDRMSRRIALKASISAFIILLVFAFAGHLIFNIFSISVNGLRVAGGFLFFGMGYDMLQAKISRIKRPKKDIKNFESDIAISPLGIPLICGPGAITITMILVQDAASWFNKILLILTIFIVLAIVFVSLISSKKILKFFGPSGAKVMMRIMGLIVMVIGIEFFFAGIKPFIRDIFKI